MSGVTPMEVIDLDSDEDVIDEKKARNDVKSEKTINASCINFNCRSGANMKTASTFACSFYGINSTKKKKRTICEKCLESAINHQEILARAMFLRKPLLRCNFPDHKISHIDLSDSDSDKDENSVHENYYIPEEVLLDIEENLEAAMAKVFKKCDVDFQVRESCKVLKAQYDNIDRENEKLDKDLDSLILKMDSLRNSFYDHFKPNIKTLEDIEIEEGTLMPTPIAPSLPPPSVPPLPIPAPAPTVNTTPTSLHSLVATKKVTQVRMPQVTPPKLTGPQDINQIEVMKVQNVDKFALGYDLPPHGPLTRRLPELDSIVLVMKHPLMPWIKAKVHSILSRNPMTYRVKYIQKKYNNQLKNMFGKQLAVYSRCPVIIPVSTRVVAVFNDIQTSNYYSGVIAEPPKATNKYRYLVFFDDGYAQYVLHKHIFVVSESSSRVWEDIPIESRDFVKRYLETFPERPMVKLQQGQVVKTEWNGKWWIARVIQVDASLVQMHFDADGRTEWIYRGSTRLGPLWLELLKANARQQGHHAPVVAQNRHRMAGPLNKINVSQPYVEYTSGMAELDVQISEIPKSLPPLRSIASRATVPALPPPPVVAIQSRAVAKKSTARKSTSTMSQSSSMATEITFPHVETKPAHSIVYYQTQNKIRPRKYVVHECGPKCIEGITYTPDDLKGFSPLSIPLLCGWNRQLCKYNKGKKVTMYQAPCGLRLRNMDEVHKYLRSTKSAMSVDLFDFDHWVHCLAEFVLDKCFVNIKDLSYGVENVLIPCVNEIDHALPDTIRYSTKREPTEGVNLNLDPDFLCSCDCEDDCADKSKCQCWQLTIQGATFGGRVPNNSVGYVYKRLPESVSTGIYECNSRCKCSVKTCLNRVVQHPLTLKLQVFKTAPRGWGIRCLNDIPIGSFICIYAGRLLTEQGANEGGKNYGDEYLAELDYVEVVEGMKADYESEALEPVFPANEPPGEPTPRPKTPEEEEEEEVEEPSSYKKKGTNDSDEEFNIKQYNNEYSRLDSESDDSMRRRLRKRKKSEENIVLDGPDEKSQDGSSGKAGISEKNEKGEQQEGSDEEEKQGRREPSRFEPTLEPSQIERPRFKSVRDFFGADEAVYIMDAKTTGNIGRYLNHSCDPNVFVQNVFVDTHDVRFPWVAFFALNFIRAGQELTWNYSYDVGSIPGKVIICRCGAPNCRGRLL